MSDESDSDNEYVYDDDSAGPGWNDTTWNNHRGWLWSGKVFIPNSFNQNHGAAAIFLAPEGGRSNIKLEPRFVKGSEDEADYKRRPRKVRIKQLSDDDDRAFGEIEDDDSDPDDDDKPWDWNIVLHLPRPEKGETGDSGKVLEAEDVESDGDDGQMLVKDGDDMVWATPRYTSQYVATDMSENTDSDDGKDRTIAKVKVPSQDFDWIPRVSGQTIVEADSNVKVDLVSRLHDDSGDVVGRCFGLTGKKDRLHLATGIPYGKSKDKDYGKVKKGESAHVILRTEQDEEAGGSGGDYETDRSTTWFTVDVVPIK